MDPCSLSNLEYFMPLSLDWQIEVNFDREVLVCKATQLFKCIKNGSSSLVLDTNTLDVIEVSIKTLDDSDGENAPVSFAILDEVVPFGQPLEIKLFPQNCSMNATFSVCITYETSPKATAIQWMKTQQTLDKKHPYLFTQCQAIHARSLLPCQDSPGRKIPYVAKVTVSQEMETLMSALKGEVRCLENGKKECCFKQEIPVPTYLLALAVGHLESRVVGPRSKVWCEPSNVDACAKEFDEVETMIQVGESILGEYVWGQYDLLILPPSFPYGGMENPCLTFVTPTLVVGDKSLTSVVAHEITHSWTGNLVTNLNWEHFWLNEGFTRFVEGKICGKLYGEEIRQFMAIAGWNSLRDTINTFGPENPLTALTPVLEKIDPDDAFSSVPYEKGYAFLYYIESLVGGPSVFDPFLKSYIQKFRSSPLVTEEFKTYLLDYFSEQSEKLKVINWNAWLHSPGMPPVDVIDMYDKELTEACEKLSNRWVNATDDDLVLFKPEDFTEFTTLQKINFLTKMYQKKEIPLKHLQKMAELYKLRENNNSEIKFVFYRLCVRAQWSEMFPDVVEFITWQGRMKYVRPLYREMYAHEGSKELAIKTFEDNRSNYHSITANMVAKDLHLN